MLIQLSSKSSSNALSGLFKIKTTSIPAIAAISSFVFATISGIVSLALYSRLSIAPNVLNERYIGIALATSLLFVLIMQAFRRFDVTALLGYVSQLKWTFLCWSATFMILGWLAFLLQITSVFSRGAIGLMFGLGLAALLAGHALMAYGLRWALARSRMALNSAIVVSTSDKAECTRSLGRLKMFGTSIDARVSIPVSRKDECDSGWWEKQMADSIDAIVKQTRGRNVDAIYIAVDWTNKEVIDRLVEGLRNIPIPAYLIPDDRINGYLGLLRHIGPTATVELKRGPLTEWDRAIKRTFDIVVSTAGLLALSPIMAIAAVMIKLDSKGPVIFRQRRHGFNSREFVIYKFRTMTQMDDGTEVKQATRGDLRITRVGRILRRTSIDELPQLFNVLIGNMSIVGPRPHAKAHDHYYGELISDYAFRQHVKPGITGWAQARGHRGETPHVGAMQSRVEHDLWYINHWSIWLDIHICIRTALVMLFQREAV